MRGRRRKLQVSTFPFLAVLLCAMGSLILLLLVIDRQAKVVARNKALLAAAEELAKRKKLDAGRQAEWDSRRRALHAQLAQQRNEVLGGLRAARGREELSARELLAEEARSQELRQRLQAEMARLEEAQRLLSARRRAAKEAVGKVAATGSARGKLAAELEEMERAIAAIRELKQRERQTYSLVPYRGKRGDTRRPIYLECTAGGAIFHPDRLTLDAADDARLRAEVEKRATRRQTGAPGAKAYLLMLVRPEGIVTYYRTMAALDGLKVDFGYEFIDPDWLLDFPEDDEAAVQPWMVAQPGPAALPKGGLPGLPRPPAGALASGTPGRKGTGPGPDDHLPRPPGFPVPSGNGAGTGGNREGTGPGTGGLPFPGTVAENGAGGKPLAGGTGAPGRIGFAQSHGGFRGSGNSLFSTGPRAGEGGAAGPGRPPVLGVPQPLAGGAGSDGPGAFSRPGGRETSGPGAGGAQGNVRPGARGEGGKGPPGQGAQKPGEGGAPAGPAGPGRGAPGPVGQKADAPFTPTLPRPPAAGKPTQAQGAPAPKPPEGQRRGPAEQGSGEAADRPVPRLLQAPTGTRAPVPLSRLTGNRDWVIGVECTADEVILQPWGKRFAASAEKGPALVEAVRGLIARRQATVRPGEPPYRPLLRFQVRPDGLRSYYFAYPLLEPLRVPMARETPE